MLSQSDPAVRGVGSSLGRLLSPARLGPLAVRNRLWIEGRNLPHGSRDPVAEPDLRFWAERSREVGVIMLDALAVHRSGARRADEPLASDPGIVAHYRRFVTALGASGVSVLACPAHYGRARGPGPGGDPAWAPSAIACPARRVLPRAM